MDNQPSKEDRLIAAYDRMLDSLHTQIEKWEGAAKPALHHLVETAKQSASDVGELSREEAEQIGDYIKRDIQDAAHHLANTEEDLGAWFRFDLERIEDGLLQAFRNVADKTSLDLAQLQQDLHQSVLYHTGEITGPGTLHCTACKRPIHFHGTGHIPPCPSCKHTEFQRDSGEA